MEATCASTKEDIQQPNHMCYSLWINVYGVSFCSCPGFLKGDGACKHLWALCAHFPRLIASKMLHPGYYGFNYPQTKADALKIHTEMYASTLRTQNCTTLGDKSLDNGKKIQSLTESTTHLGQLSSRINSWLLNTGNEDQSSNASDQLQEDNFNSGID